MGSRLHGNDERAPPPLSKRGYAKVAEGGKPAPGSGTPVYAEWQ